MKAYPNIKNENAPAYFSEWVIRNLRQTYSKEAMVKACISNITDFPEQRQLFENFLMEMNVNTHQELLAYYEMKSVQP